MATKADLRYVAKPASDASGKVASPIVYPRSLYPEVEPFASGHLAVGSGHEIYYEECGNKAGIPAVFLHGGPGAGCDARSRRFFDPPCSASSCSTSAAAGRAERRGRPGGSLVENTTPALVGDLEQLREALKIDTWGLVLGGSWGSTLALAYAQAHPDRVRSLLLRGVFTFCADEVEYLFVDGGTAGQNPDAWDRYLARASTPPRPRPRTSLADPLTAYWDLLTGADADARNAAAAAFVGYELSLSVLHRPGDHRVRALAVGAHPFAVMEVHYMRGAGFMERGQLLRDAKRWPTRATCSRRARADACRPWRHTASSRRSRPRACRTRTRPAVRRGRGHPTRPGLVDAMVRVRRPADISPSHEYGPPPY
ncbi:alpha/beta hydrolase [Aureococcus anophagefferens]|nr:alpha/beta hydrolase [Aureococcus anophagefferens]